MDNGISADKEHGVGDKDDYNGMEWWEFVGQMQRITGKK